LRSEKKGKKMLSKKQIKLREFELSDLEYVKNLIKRTIDICYRDVYCKEIVDFFDMFHWYGNILKTAQDGYIVVAEVQGKIVGTGGVIGGAVLRVFVDPAYQKQGLGKMIMNELEMRATANGVKTVRLRALANAKKFYESLGYLTVANSLVEVDTGRHFEYYQMEKRLK
jgi:GNAT superfamily N-acetyltransferase